MTKHPAGTVVWAEDPIEAHDSPRPVVVLSHEHHPFSASDCAVVCLGTSAGSYDHKTPEITTQHLSGISFSKQTYLMPWALYTIPPAAIRNGKPQGKLTEQGETLVKKSLIGLFSE